MIETFASRETEKIFLGEISPKLPADIQCTARRKLLYLDEAENLQDIRVVPGNRMEKLKGDRTGQNSILGSIALGLMISGAFVSR